MTNPIVPLIGKLKEQGITVSILHDREKSHSEVATPSGFNGCTVVKIGFPREQEKENGDAETVYDVTRGVATCCNLDNFCKRTGVIKAFSKAWKIARDEGLVTREQAKEIFAS